MGRANWTSSIILKEEEEMEVEEEMCWGSGGGSWNEEQDAQKQFPLEGGLLWRQY